MGAYSGLIRQRLRTADPDQMISALYGPSTPAPTPAPTPVPPQPVAEPAPQPTAPAAAQPEAPKPLPVVRMEEMQKPGQVLNYEDWAAKNRARIEATMPARPQMPKTYSKGQEIGLALMYGLQEFGGGLQGRPGMGWQALRDKLERQEASRAQIAEYDRTKPAQLESQMQEGYGDYLQQTSSRENIEHNRYTRGMQQRGAVDAILGEVRAAAASRKQSPAAILRVAMQKASTMGVPITAEMVQAEIANTTPEGPKYTVMAGADGKPIGVQLNHADGGATAGQQFFGGDVPQDAQPLFGARTKAWQEEQAREDKRFSQRTAAQANAQAQAMVRARVDSENKLRDDFNKAVQGTGYPTVKQYYDRITAVANDPSAAGDLAMIFSYMKILDPTSVVREGEQATAQNATGVPDQVRNAYNRVMAGERLNPQQRADFVRKASQMYQQAETARQNVEAQYQGIAQRSGLDARNVIVNPAVSAPAAMTMQDAQGNVWVLENGQWVIQQQATKPPATPAMPGRVSGAFNSVDRR